MANNNWGSGLPSGPSPKAEGPKADGEESPRDSDNDTESPTWTAPSFGPVAAVGVVPAKEADVPRAVTLERPRPEESSGDVRVPASPYPSITESFNAKAEIPSDAASTPSAVEERPSPDRKVPPRSNTLLYGTPKPPDIASPVGPSTWNQSSNNPSLADDDDDTILNAVAPSSPHPKTEIPPEPKTQDQSVPNDVSAAAEKVPAPSVVVAHDSLSPALSTSDPQSLANDDVPAYAKTVRIPDAHPVTEHQDLHTAKTKEAPTAKTEEASSASLGDDVRPQASSPLASSPQASSPQASSPQASSPQGPIPSFDDETSRDAPSPSASFFADADTPAGEDLDVTKVIGAGEANGAESNDPVASKPTGNDVEAQRFDSGDADESKTTLDPTASAAFFASPGPSGSSDHSDDKNTKSSTSPASEKPKVATAAKAVAKAPVGSFDGIDEEMTERVDRTAPGGPPLNRKSTTPEVSHVTPSSDDDEDYALVVQRSKRNTMIAAAIAVLLLLATGVGAFVLGVFDPDEERLAKGSGRDITKDARRPLYGDGTDEDGTKSDDAKSDDAKSDDAKSDDAKSDGAKSDGAKSDDAKPDAAKSDDDARTNGQDSNAAAADDDESSTKIASAIRSKDNGEPERRRSRSRRSRSRKPTGDNAVTTSEPEAIPEVAVKKANTVSRTIKTKAPRHIRWMSTANKELGRGNGTLKLASSTKSVIAFDPRRGVRTKVQLKNKDRLVYGALPTGTLEVRVFPYAEVWLGSEKVGTTPFAPLRLVPGKYKLKLVYEKKTRRETITIRPKKIKRVKVNFNNAQ